MEDVKIAFANYKQSKRLLEYVVCGKFPIGSKITYRHGKHNIELKILKHLNDMRFSVINEKTGVIRVIHITSTKEWADAFPICKMFGHTGNQIINNLTS